MFSEPDLLLLDEPTNHLDLEAALWLERFLRRYRHTFALVSHDRQLLNAATTATLHLENGKLTLYSGGFEKFLRARREAATRQAVLARRQQQERERLQGFIDRFRAKASKARQAQSRMKALARLEPVALIEDAPPPVLRLPQPTELSPPLVALERASVGYAAGPAGTVAARSAARPRRPDRAARRQRQRQDHLCPAARRAAGAAGGPGDPIAEADLRLFRAAPDRGDAARESAFDHLAALMPDAPPEAVRTRLGGFGFGQDKALFRSANCRAASGPGSTWRWSRTTRHRC